jgi:hypothetical protein
LNDESPPQPGGLSSFFGSYIYSLCPAPHAALRNSTFCYWHHEARRRRNHHAQPVTPGPNVAGRNLVIPLIEDADSILVTIQEVMHAIVEGRIDRPSAGLLLYALQTASHIMPQHTQQDLHGQIYSVSKEQLIEDDLALPDCSQPDDDDEDKDSKENDSNSDNEDDDSDSDSDSDDDDDDDESDDSDSDDAESDDDADNDADDDDSDSADDSDDAGDSDEDDDPDSDSDDTDTDTDTDTDSDTDDTDDDADGPTIDIDNIPALRKYLKSQSALLEAQSKRTG